MSPKRETRQQRMAREWTHPKGTQVQVTLDDGSVITGLTTYGPAVIGGVAVIWIDEIIGCYRLDRCTVAAEAAPTSPTQAA